MNNKTWRIKRLCVMAMICAMAYAIVAFVRIPVLLWLSYEPKDVLITIGAFLFGPLSASIMSLVVSLVEMVTISNTGIIGMVMNVLSTCLFACTASAVYRKKRSLSGAILGLALGFSRRHRRYVVVELPYHAALYGDHASTGGRNVVAAVFAV